MKPEDEWFCPQCDAGASDDLREEKSRSSTNLPIDDDTRSGYILPKEPAHPQYDRGQFSVEATPYSHPSFVHPSAEAEESRIPHITVDPNHDKRAFNNVARRPLVDGISGNRDRPCVSVVATPNAAYPLFDRGDNLTYTGQGTDRNQLLSDANLALARTCDCPIPSVAEANLPGCRMVAKDWRRSQPIRVVRGAGKTKGRTMSAYVPQEGYRYDGLYKVVEYERIRGRDGFWMWQFHLRRDDPTPAPWTPAGEQLRRELGLTFPPNEHSPFSNSRKRQVAPRGASRGIGAFTFPMKGHGSGGKLEDSTARADAMTEVDVDDIEDIVDDQ
ncbi:ubiquitin-like with PHD and RING finger domains 2 [Gonapodya sp. JEL0774]|nr:ubiquitin-like with PHD and RING finger domains 2 [Gonapodya sp. JEL0774]